MQKTLQLAACVAIATILSACAVSPTTVPVATPEPEQAHPQDLDWPAIAQDFEQTGDARIAVTELPEGGLKLVIPAADGFDTGKAELQPALQTSLDELTGPISRHPELTVHILGHTDSIGREGYNMVLSRQRARAVQDYLMAAGIAPLRLSSEGRGEMEPVADNDTPEGRSQNRRVEILLHPAPSSQSPRGSRGL